MSRTQPHKLRLCVVLMYLTLTFITHNELTIMNEVNDYRMEMIRLITDYINDKEYVSQTDYLECIDYLLDFNSNANYKHV